MESPLVSILIPIYNAEKYLRECLDSLLAQSYRNFEAICVNDGSTDSSADIVAEYATKDTRFKLISKENEGPSAARNAALKHVSGEYIMKLDADDYVSPNYIESAIKRMREDCSDGAISKMGLLLDSGNVVFEHYNNISFDKTVISGEKGLIQSINWESIHSLLILHKKVYDGVIYDTSGTFGDEVTERELISKCNQLSYFNGIYYYRYNEESVTKKVSPKIFSLALSRVQTADLLKRKNVWDKCKDSMQDSMLQTLVFLQYYYYAHYSKFSRTARKDASKKIKMLFQQIDKNYTAISYRNKGLVRSAFMQIKMASFFNFKMISRVLFFFFKSKYGY